MADLTNLIAAGPPRWDTDYFSRILDQTQRGRDDEFTQRNRDLWKNGVPMKGEEPDWGRAMMELMRAGGAGSVQNAVGLSGLQTLNEPSLLGPSGQQSGGGGLGGDAKAIASIESAGSGDYSAQGPVTKTGDRAHGKYGVMGVNVGPWTQEVTGRAMTPEEFRQNPQVQDAVFKQKFGEYTQKTGSPQKAALMWFTGGAGPDALRKQDQLGTTGAGYLQKFVQNGGGGAAPQSNLMSGFVPPRWVGRELELARGLLRQEERLDARKPGSGKAAGEAARAIIRSFEQNAEEERKRESTRQKEGGERETKAFESLLPRAEKSKEDADKAAQNIRAIHESRALIDQGIFSGADAEIKLGMSKIAATLGIPSDKAANTEAFMTAAGQQVVSIIGAFGSGSGISSTDREYAAKMAAGNVKLEEKALRFIMDMNEKVARAKIGRHNQLIGKFGKASKTFKGEVESTYGVDDPGTYKAPQKQAKGTQDDPIKGIKTPEEAMALGKGKWFVRPNGSLGIVQ